MLLLMRKVGEKIMIGDDIVITVMGSMDGKTRLGIEAPRHIRIDREEVRQMRDYDAHFRPERDSWPDAFEGM